MYVYFKLLAHKNVSVQTSLHGVPALFWGVTNLLSHPACVRFLSFQHAAQVQSIILHGCSAVLYHSDFFIFLRWNLIGWCKQITFEMLRYTFLYTLASKLSFNYILWDFLTSPHALWFNLILCFEFFNPSKWRQV